MSITTWLRHLKGSISQSSSECLGRRRRFDRRRRPVLTVEEFEDRSLLSVQYGSPGLDSVVNNGTVLSQVNVELVFWGSGWGGGPSADSNAVAGAVSTMLSGTYLSGLTQYGAATNGSIVGQAFISDHDLSGWGHGDNTFTDDTVKVMLLNELDNGNLDEDAPQNIAGLVYLVVPQRGISSTQADGAHSVVTHVDRDLLGLDTSYDSIYYGWSTNPGGPIDPLTTSWLDTVTENLSHELVETITDPVPGQGVVDTKSSAPENEICDYLGGHNSLGHRYSDGTLVQAYWSAVDNHFIVPDGTPDGVGGLLSLDSHRTLSRWTPTSGEVTLAQNVQSYAIDGRGDIAIYNTDGTLFRYTPTSGVVGLATNVQAFAMDPNTGDDVFLDADGRLFRYAPNGDQRWFVGNVQSFALDPNTGDEVYLDTDGRLFRYAPNGDQQWFGGNVQSFTLDPKTGDEILLDTYGRLFRNAPNGDQRWFVGNVQSFAVDPNTGDEVYLDTYGRLFRYAPNGDQQWFGGNVQSFTLDPKTGDEIFLATDGDLFRYNPGGNQVWHETNVKSFALDGAGAVVYQQTGDALLAIAASAAGSGPGNFPNQVIALDQGVRLLGCSGKIIRPLDTCPKAILASRGATSAFSAAE